MLSLMLIFGGLNSGTSGTFQSTNAAVNGSKVTMTQEKLLKTKLAELSFQISSDASTIADAVIKPIMTNFSRADWIKVRV